MYVLSSLYLSDKDISSGDRNSIACKPKIFTICPFKNFANLFLPNSQNVFSSSLVSEILFLLQDQDEVPSYEAHLELKFFPFSFPLTITHI